MSNSTEPSGTSKKSKTEKLRQRLIKLIMKAFFLSVLDIPDASFEVLIAADWFHKVL